VTIKINAKIKMVTVHIVSMASEKLEIILAIRIPPNTPETAKPTNLNIKSLPILIFNSNVQIMSGAKQISILNTVCKSYLTKIPTGSKTLPMPETLVLNKNTYVSPRIMI
jgi:hypothetical protein